MIDVTDTNGRFFGDPEDALLQIIKRLRPATDPEYHFALDGLADGITMLVDQINDDQKTIAAMRLLTALECANLTFTQ